MTYKLRALGDFCLALTASLTLLTLFTQDSDLKK